MADHVKQNQWDRDKVDELNSIEITLSKNQCCPQGITGETDMLEVVS
jgi:hypothetical protein